jgi:hypothetical protein
MLKIWMHHVGVMSVAVESELSKQTTKLSVREATDPWILFFRFQHNKSAIFDSFKNFESSVPAHAVIVIIATFILLGSEMALEQVCVLLHKCTV